MAYGTETSIGFWVYGSIDQRLVGGDTFCVHLVFYLPESITNGEAKLAQHRIWVRKSSADSGPSRFRWLA